MDVRCGYFTGKRCCNKQGHTSYVIHKAKMQDQRPKELPMTQTKILRKRVASSFFGNNEIGMTQSGIIQ